MVLIVQVSDTHLSPFAPFAEANWRTVVDHVRSIGADLVVHTGDITLNGVRDPDELTYARERLDRLGIPWLAVPGNHDVGDPGSGAHGRLRYEGVFGERCWATIVEGWQLVGVDVQALMSEPVGEGPTWQWLDDVLCEGSRAALFVHRPVRPWPGDVDDADWYVTEPSRQRLSEMIAQGDVRLVASGHLHRWRRRSWDGCWHVWAPSTWAMLPETTQPSVGSKVVGAVVYQLGVDGRVEAHLMRPAGIAQVTIDDDFVSPYPAASHEPAAVEPGVDHHGDVPVTNSIASGLGA